MIEFYNKDKHYSLISKWYKDHKQNVPDSTIFPKIGLIVDNVVAGFLYQTDSSICLIENVISDKHSNKEQRRKAIDTLLFQLVDIAKELNYTLIMACPAQERLVSNHMRWGFNNKNKNQKVVFRSLK